MADLPILFSAAMVRAILREIEQPGTGKTQTRRVITSARVFATPERPAWTLRGDDLARAVQNADRFRHMGEDGWFWEADAFPWQAPATRTGWLAHIGFAPGDRLYVREAHYITDDGEYERAVYAADADAVREHLAAIDALPSYFSADLRARHKRLRPPMHMPRWAARITLIVTDVRVQRLQEISEADARAEGVDRDSDGWRDYQMPSTQCCATARDGFRTLWESLNAARGYGWDRNPWVAAYTFRPVLGNIDQVQP